MPLVRFVVILVVQWSLNKQQVVQRVVQQFPTNSQKFYNESKHKSYRFSHTRYRALGPELMLVYSLQAVIPQVTWSEWRHRSGGRLSLINIHRACGYLCIFHQIVPPVHGSTHPIPAYYSFIDPKRTKGWVGLVGLPVADGLSTIVVTHQLQVEHRTGKVCRPETDVLPLCHATTVVQVPYCILRPTCRYPVWGMDVHFDLIWPGLGISF